MIGLRHWGSTEEEIASPMPGDEFVASPNQVGTRSVTIHSEPDLVFDFIAQMGFGRAGWYSYDWLDNLGRRSATSINQAWQIGSAGEIVPAGSISFVAVVVERPTRFVLHVPTRRFAGHQVDFTLSYLLSRIDSSTPRLLDYSPRLPCPNCDHWTARSTAIYRASHRRRSDGS